MLRPTPLGARVRFAVRRLIERARAAARRAAVTLARVAPVPLAVVAVLLIVVQPSPDPVDLDALIAIAGIVATVLSLGFTVTLLVAQHTAERHARAQAARCRVPA